MRIAVNGRFLAAVATGVQRFALGITRELVGAADVRLLLPRDAELPRDLVGVRTRRGRSSSHAWEQLELPVAARAERCDVTLHLANSLPLLGGPHAVVLHDATVFQNPHWFSTRYALWHRRFVLPAARRAAAVGTLSRHAAEELAPLLGCAVDQLTVIPQGAAPLDVPAGASAVARARKRFGLEGPYLLAVGSGDPRKNVAFIERVLARWISEHGESPPVLVIVGAPVSRVFAADGSAASPLGGGVVVNRSLLPGGITRAAPEPRIVHTGRVDDETLRALYSGAEAFCFPSLAEGFGRPPLEALACGAPVLVSPYGPAHEVLAGAARIVELDEGKWVEELRRMLREGRRPDKAAAARAVVERHQWEDGALAAIELCERALEPRHLKLLTRARSQPAKSRAERKATARGKSSPAFAARVTEITPSPGKSPTRRRVRATRDAHAKSASSMPSTTPPLPDRVAIVHDWLTGMRGGEKVLEALLELFPSAEIFTLMHVPGSVSPVIESRPIHTSFVQQLPGAVRHYRRYLPLFPSAVERFDLRGYDLVLSSSHCVAKGARAMAPHLCYCHTPMRYMWDQFDAYFGPGRASLSTRAAAWAVAPGLRRWDRASASRVDHYVANSEHVRARIRSIYGRESTVVYPPVDVERFRPAALREDFYLIVSALVPYKRVDLAVEAFRELDRPLIVVGSGPELPRLRVRAGRNVRFNAWASDEEVASLMERCRALLMPGVEDFGIVPVEAQAAGAPVIAYGAGGALETVVEPDEGGRGGTGVFFHDLTPRCLARAVRRFESLEFEPVRLISNAWRFGRARFLDEMRAALDDVLTGAPAEPTALETGHDFSGDGGAAGRSPHDPSRRAPFQPLTR